MNDSIDIDEIKALGLDLTDDQVATLVRVLQQQIEQRVAVAIMELLDEKEASELKRLAEGSDQSVVGEWITAHVPEYRDVVEDEHDILIGEVIENPSRFLAASNS